MFEDSFISELFAIDWFSRCGKGPFVSPLSGIQVSSWSEAIKLSSATEWENTTLEARNDLTQFLHSNYLNLDRNWSVITRQAKASVICPLTEQHWTPFAVQHGLGKNFLNCVQWDILAACMENAYRQCDGLPSFFSEILNVYRAGHYPCGWSSGEYPSGHLSFW